MIALDAWIKPLKRNFTILQELNFKYIGSGINFDSNKYNQKFLYFHAMTKWMANNYFSIIKIIYSAFIC